VVSIFCVCVCVKVHACLCGCFVRLLIGGEISFVLLVVKGTHAERTSQIGWIKLTRTMRISDGTVRIYFGAGELALAAANKETDVLQALKDSWDVGTNEDLISTGARFFAVRRGEHVLRARKR
jgi:alanyl-tRNA synthetase